MEKYNYDSTNDYKIPIAEILREIDKFKIINKIIELNFNREKFEITNDDLKNFKYNIVYFVNNFNKQRFKNVINSLSLYTFQDEITVEDKFSFLKQFILLVYKLVVVLKILNTLLTF